MLTTPWSRGVTLSFAANVDDSMEHSRAGRKTIEINQSINQSSINPKVKQTFNSLVMMEHYRHQPRCADSYLLDITLNVTCSALYHLKSLTL